MKSVRVLVLLVCAGAPASLWAQQWSPPTAMKKLPNGLAVVVSEDHSAPTIGVCISYGIGFRLEPEGRTGFAHLFEHMMFEGTPDAPKGVFDRVVEGGGGFNNGDTRYDFTEYIESGPVSALEPILWLEADRMKDLDFSIKNLENQRNVVEEEVRVNVMNQPYGLFFAIDLPGKAFDTYPNNHNFYGDFRDLDAAKIGDVKKFFEEYYAPNNAVLAIVGDIKIDDGFALAEKYFDGVPSRQVPPRPDVRERPQTAERTAQETDKLAQVPALAIGYRMPPHGSQDAIVAAVTGELLHNGDASMLYQSLVKGKQVALSVSGGTNWPLGDPFEYNGPTLMTSFLVYPPNLTEDRVIAAYDGVIADLAKNGPSQAEITRVVTKMRSDRYDELEIPISRASALSHAVLFDGSFAGVYSIPQELEKITPEEVKAFAAKYLVATNRTIINRVPARAQGAPKQGGAQ
ncbi:MAG TPA: pitrilysin family protein [Candidatus Acidoferrales bacterium]|nr:pitrilysin family protein [Candidatus Acidoferrales bacterium]